MIDDYFITNEDRDALIACEGLKNFDYAETIMQILEKYQVLQAYDIEMLASREKCRELFKSDYAILLQVSEDVDLSTQVKDRTGRNRYYTQVHLLRGKSYVMTSQLYGMKTDSTHNDNRTPFLKWVLNRFDMQRDSNYKWWPAAEEYDPSLSKEQWVDYLNNHLISNTRGMSALAALYDIGGSATMRELADKYGRTADFYRNVLGSISEKAVEYFGIAAYNQKNAKT